MSLIYSHDQSVLPYSSIEQFYGIFPANTLTNFKTKLAQPLELIGEWEVALSEFQYPRSWYTLRNLDNHIYVNSGSQGYPSVSIIPHGYYPTVKEFVFNVLFSAETDANGDICLMYNQLT